MIPIAEIIASPQFKNQSCINPFIRVVFEKGKIWGYQIIASIPLTGDSEWDHAIKLLFEGWKPPTSDPYDLCLVEYIKGELALAIYWFRYYKFGQKYRPKIERESPARSTSKLFLDYHKPLGKLLYALWCLAEAEFNCFDKLGHEKENNTNEYYGSPIVLWFYVVREIFQPLVMAKKDKTNLIKKLKTIRRNNKTEQPCLYYWSNPFNYEETPHLYFLIQVAIQLHVEVSKNRNSTYPTNFHNRNDLANQLEYIWKNLLISSLSDWINNLETSYFRTAPRNKQNPRLLDTSRRHQKSSSSSKDKKLQANKLICEVINQLLEQCRGWQGTTTELLKELNNLNSEVSEFFKKPEGLGMHLGKLEFALQQKGIVVKKERLPGGTKRLITLSKVA